MARAVDVGEIVRRAFVMMSTGIVMFACAGHQQETAKDPESGQGTTSDAATSSTSAPLDVEALLARETDGLSPQKVEQKGFTASVLAKGTPTIVPNKAGATIEIPIGTQATVKCLIFNEDPDPGATLFGAFERLKTVGEIKDVRLSEMELVKDIPILGVTLIYIVHGPRGNQFGQLKLLHHPRLNHSTLCLHDEPGYAKTFAKVARSLFESEDRGIQEPAPEYMEVQLAYVNGVPAGYDKTAIFAQDGGTRTVIESGLQILMRSPTDINASDTAKVMNVDAHGMIADAHYVNDENGRVTLDLTTMHKKGSAYDYKGIVAGKEVTGSFKTKDKRGLTSTMETEKQLARHLAQGGAFSMKDESYDPDSDPTKTSPVEFRHEKGDPARVVRMKMAHVEVVGTADEAGRMKDGEMKIGPLTVTMKRAVDRSAR